jgi:hypothetical protein
VVLEDDDAFVLPLAEEAMSLFSYRTTTWSVDPDQRRILTPDEVADAMAVLERRSSHLAASYAGSRTFCDGYTEAWIPSVRHTDGLVAVGGCSGSGVRLASGLAVSRPSRDRDPAGGSSGQAPRQMPGTVIHAAGDGVFDHSHHHVPLGVGPGPGGTPVADRFDRRAGFDRRWRDRVAVLGQQRVRAPQRRSGTLSATRPAERSATVLAWIRGDVAVKSATMARTCRSAVSARPS